MPKAWPIEKIDFLRKNYCAENKEMLCQTLGMKWGSIKHAASKYNVVMPNRWTQEMLDYVKNNYHQDKKEDLLKFTGKSWDDVRHIAKRLGVKIVKTSKLDWTDKDIQAIQDYYNTKDQTILKKQLRGRTKGAIYGKAFELGLKFNKDDEKSFYNTNTVEKLLENTPESFYWIGYILADGSFYKDAHMKISLSNKDKQQMLNLGQLINCTVIDDPKRPMCTINAGDKHNIPKILEKFDIKPRKTYNPPDPKHYDRFSDELIFWLFVGYIDGDGSIKYSYNKSSGSITFVCHGNWKNFVEYIINRVAKMFNEEPITTLKINKQNHVIGHISKLTICHKIKKKIEESGLPVLNRKWDKINSSFVPRYEKEKQNNEIIKELILQGLTHKQIKDQTGFGMSKISSVHQQIKSEKSLDNPTPSQ